MKPALVLAAALCALCATARADEGDGDDDPPAINSLGFHLALGSLPIAHDHVTAGSLGVDIEHPVFRRTHVFGEYEWLWLQSAADPAMPETATRHGDGHRVLVGLRRAVIDKRLRHLRMFVDGEVGGGMALVSDNIDALHVLPTGFAGLRLGYALHHEDSPSRTFEIDMLVRVLRVPDGTGVGVGAVLLWGN